jgi:hypothetical protein
MASNDPNAGGSDGTQDQYNPDEIENDGEKDTGDDS